MLREVRVDVPNGRITSVAPLAVFVPIFRKLPMLFENEFGYFLPLWNEVTLPTVGQLPAEEEPLRNSPTLPFFDINPLVPKTEIRNTPAIAEALRLSGKKENTKAVQIIQDYATAFPMDLRKWHNARGYTMTLDEFLAQPEASFDVVISQFALWESEMLDVILSKIIPGGVWYFNELLPVDFPGHWLYHASDLGVGEEEHSVFAYFL